MGEMIEVHAKLVMVVNTNSGVRFKSNRAIKAVRGYNESELVEAPLIPTSKHSSRKGASTTRTGSSMGSYLEKRKLILICGVITIYQDLKSQFQALTENC